MKDLFPEYYRQSSLPSFDDRWEKTALFVFDANVLLNLYGFSSRHREQWLTSLEELKDRIFLPYQAALEYHRNLQKKLGQIVSLTEQETPKAFVDCRNPLQNKLPRTNPLHDDATIAKEQAALLKAVNECLPRIQAVISAWKPTFDKEWTTVRDRLSNTFSKDTVGQPPPTEMVRAWCSAGETRYAQNQPPGYKDAKKEDGNPYGDLFIWFEMMELSQKRKAPIVFVTFEVKEDWCKKENKQATARQELVNEFLLNTGHEFELAPASRFWDWIERRKGPVEGAKEEVDAASTDFRVLHDADTFRATVQPLDLDAKLSAIDQALSSRAFKICQNAGLADTFGRIPFIHLMETFLHKGLINEREWQDISAICMLVALGMSRKGLTDEQLRDLPDAASDAIRVLDRALERAAPTTPTK